MDAYLSGLEQAHAAGRDLTSIRSVASFFVSRVDTEVDARLDHLGTPEAAALKGSAAIANARLAYQAHEQLTATERWQRARPPRRAAAAAAVGLHRSQGSRLPRHQVRRRADRARHRQHHAGPDPGSLRRPRPGQRRHHHRELRRRPRVSSASWRQRASISMTSPSTWNATAWPSSRRAGASWALPSPPNWNASSPSRTRNQGLCVPRPRGRGLQGGLLGRELAAVAGDFPQPGVHRLDQARRADHLADLGREGQERGELGPVRPPQAHDRRIAVLPGGGEGLRRSGGRSLVSGDAGRAQVAGQGRPVFAGGIPAARHGSGAPRTTGRPPGARPR